MDRLDHILGTAIGWGGNRRDAAMHETVAPERNDGVAAYVLTIGYVPLSGFLGAIAT